MKIGVLTYHRSINYGAFLQAYSLCERLNREDDITAEIIDFQMRKEIQHYSEKTQGVILRHPIRYFHDIQNNKKQGKLFTDALVKMTLSSEHLVSDSIDDFIQSYAGKYDVIITGSDEIWKTDGFRGFPTPYWLIGNLNCRKFSYAASGRNNFSKLSIENQQKLRNAINDYEYIGVRDNSTKVEIEKYSNKDKQINLCCDPTFLIDHTPNIEKGKKILKERFGVDTTKKVIGIMTEYRTISADMGRILNSDKYELLSLYQWQPACKDGSLIDPFEWIDVLGSLDVLITTFFHAVCFASKLGTPMIAFGSKEKSSKVLEVVKQVGREQDYVDNIQSVLNENVFEKMIEEKINSTPQHYIADAIALSGYQNMIKALRGKN